MKGIFLNTLAHPRLDCARLHPSRRRVLAAPGFGTDANQLTFPDPLGFARPFAPSSPCPDTRAPGGTNRRFYFAATMGITSFTSPRPLRPASTNRRTRSPAVSSLARKWEACPGR